MTSRTAKTKRTAKAKLSDIAILTAIRFGTITPAYPVNLGWLCVYRAFFLGALDVSIPVKRVLQKRLAVVSGPRVILTTFGQCAFSEAEAA